MHLAFTFPAVIAPEYLKMSIPHWNLIFLGGWKGKLSGHCGRVTLALEVYLTLNRHTLLAKECHQEMEGCESISCHTSSPESIVMDLTVNSVHQVYSDVSE